MTQPAEEDDCRIESDPTEHKRRHVFLHAALDELLADYLTHCPEASPGRTTVLEFLEWSYSQTVNPTPTQEPRR